MTFSLLWIAGSGALALLGRWVLNFAVTYRRWKKLVNLGPGGSWFHAFLPDNVQDRSAYRYLWDAKHKDYERFGWDAISIVTYFNTKARFLIADPNIIKQIGASRTLYPKPIRMYKTLEIYGPNLVTSEGAVWTRHRKITSPAFSELNIQLVCEQTIRIVNDMFQSDWDRQGDVVHIDRTEMHMKELAMLVIMAAGYGRLDNWVAEKVPPPGHQMTLRQSLTSVLDGIFLRIAIPSFCWGSKQSRKTHEVAGLAGYGWLGKGVQHTSIAFSELAKHMRSMIIEQQQLISNGDGRKRLNDKQERRDLFGSLVSSMTDDHGAAEGDGASITFDEVFGNMFLFLLAGHETTSYALSFALGLLALETEEQEKLYDHVKGVVGDREPVYADVSKLTRVLAVFYETTRLYPAVNAIPKSSPTDAHFVVKAALNASNDASSPEFNERQGDLFIPGGSEVLLDVNALHYNPRYWKEPYAFRPDRFLASDWPRDAYCPFSVGIRACIGRRFSEVEAIMALTLIVRRYKISVATDKVPEVKGESKLERRERLLASRPVFTLTPDAVPLVFTRRR